MKEIKVSVYGWWTSDTYVKWNKETSCNCFKWGREGVKGERRWDIINLIGIVIMNPPLYNKYILIKTFNKKNNNHIINYCWLTNHLNKCSVIFSLKVYSHPCEWQEKLSWNFIYFCCYFIFPTFFLLSFLSWNFTDFIAFTIVFIQKFYFSEILFFKNADICT
jgi:hypothetical protein